MKVNIEILANENKLFSLTASSANTRVTPHHPHRPSTSTAQTVPSVSHAAPAMRLSQILLCGAGQLDPPEETPSPFRLLDLPKELRLMIFGHLTIEWKKTRVPMDKSREHFLILVNPSLPGVRILATCRFLNEEAGSIINPLLARMLKSPPTLLVGVRDLPGIMSMQSAVIPRRTFVDKLILSSSHPWTIRKIHEYRSGKDSLSALHDSLYNFTHLSSTGIKAIATFMLRIAKFNMIDFDTPNRYPPIAIAISVPSTFVTMPVTLTSSLPVRLMFKYITRQHRPRSTTVHAGMTTLARRFATDMSAMCNVWRVLSVHVMLHLADGVNSYADAKQLETDFRWAVEQGMQRWVNSIGGPPACYSGVYREGADGSPLK